VKTEIREYLACNGWVNCYDPKPEASLRLFCFSYAGGSSAAFRDWMGNGLTDIEVCPIVFPGRGKRSQETPFASIRPLVEALVKVLPQDKPFAFFGHSVGALVAFELARQLRRLRRELPIHFFASACRGARVPQADSPRHIMPEPQLLNELRRLGGTPDDLLNDPETMRVFLPVIRADCALSETYIYEAEEPLHCSITALGGMKDREVKEEELLAWRSETSLSFTSHMFQGDHFFLDTNKSELLGAVSRTLCMHSIYAGSL